MTIEPLLNMIVDAQARQLSTNIAASIEVLCGVGYISRLTAAKARDKLKERIINQIKSEANSHKSN